MLQVAVTLLFQSLSNDDLKLGNDLKPCCNRSYIL